MSALDQIVDIVITQQTAAVPQVGFGIPLLLGPNASTLAYYSSPASMLTAGFTTGDIEYIYALEAFEQALSPTLVGVGARTAAVAQIDTFSVNSAVSGHTYAFTVNGSIVSFASSDTTQTDILTGLGTALAALPTPPGTGVVSGSGGSALLTITGAAPGNVLVFSAIDTKLTHLAPTAANGVQNDINAVLNSASGNLWYGLGLCSNQDYDILQAAALIETLTKIFVGVSNDGAIATNSTTDIASQLQTKGYKRTALVYSPNSAALGMEAAWLGGQLPQTPGASTWKFKQLVGISADSYTASQRTTLIGVPGVSVGKGVNIYESVGGQNITEEGWMVGGQFIDVTVGLDWLKSTLQTAVFSQLVNNPKIPYTDKGISVIENAVRQVLQQASDAGGTGLLDSTSIVVTVSAVSSIPSNTRAQRLLPSGSVNFTARLTGAFHFVVINGTITV